MAEALSFPIEIPGADLAAIALNKIVASFGDLDREVIRAAEKSETTKAAFARLKEQFTTGAITASQFRQALESITTQSSQVRDSVRSAGIEISEAGKKSDLAKKAFDFNQIRQSILSAVGDLNAFAEAVTRLASEQAQLDANSARLGLDFNAAADAAGRFTDETDAMTSATRLAEAGIRLNQTQLEQLTRVAANFAQNTGVSTREALDKLTNGLITGAQEGLRPFGGELRAVAGETHSAEERLAALATQAGHTAQATDDAASSFARMKDSVEDAARSLATGFADGVTQMLRAGDAARSTTDDVQEMQRTLLAVGQTAGEVATRALTGFSVLLGAVSTAVASIVGGIAAIGAGLSHIVSTRGVSGTLGAMQGAFTSVASPFASFTQAALDRLIAQSEATEERQSIGEATRTRLGARESAAQVTARASATRGEAAATRELKNEKTALLLIEREITEARARERAAAEAADEADRARHNAVIDRRLEEIRVELDAVEARKRATLESEKTNLRAREERAKAETPEAARQARENDLVRRGQAERLAATETYQERLRGLYEHQMDLDATLAESSTAAFAAMGEAFAKHVDGVVNGSESVGEALQGYLSDVLAAISKEAFVKSAFYFAQGLGQLAGVVTAPLAPASFAAAAGFAAVGALAGVGSAAVRPATPSATPAGGGGERAASVSRGGASEGGATVYNISFGGPMYGTGGVRQAARQMVGAINRGGIQGGVQLLPGVLQGAGAGA